MADREAARRLRETWPVGCVIVMILSLVVGYGLSLVGWPIAGNFVGTAVLVLSGLGLYIRFHYRARDLVSPEAARQAPLATASLQDASRRAGAGLAWFAFVVCVVLSVGTFVYTIVQMRSSWSDGSLFGVMFLPGVSLWVCPFLSVLAVLTANAKRSLRSGSGGRSAEVQEAFRAAMTRVLSLVAIVICAVMTVMSLEAIRTRQQQLERPGLGFWLAAGFAILVIVGSMIHVGKRFGQGGALQESGSAEAPLTNGLADNARWVYGLFYVDREDPSIMVESRFGLGYTFNYGNPTALLIVGSFLGLGAVLFVVIGLIATSSGG